MSEVKTEYPKALYGPKGWEDLTDCKVVNSVEEEAAAKKAGYKPLTDTAKK